MENRTVEEFEQLVGDQIRRLRIDHGLTQADLADRADVSALTVHNVENGKGSTLATIVRVLRVLDATDWLADLAPDQGPSPLQMLRDTQANKPARRARKVT